MKLGYLLIFTSILQAAFEFRYPGARSDALAGSYTAVAEGIEGGVYNPASLAFNSSTEIAAYYNYLYSSLGSGLMGISLMAGPFRFYKWPVSFSILRLGANFGNQGSYAENTLVISQGFKISDYISGGLNLNVYYLQNPGELGNALTVGIDLGILAKFYRRWKMGFFIHNVNGPSLRAVGGREDLPAWVSAGVSYLAGKYSLTAIDFRKSRYHELRISVGEEVRVKDFLKLRAGLLSEGSLFRFTSGLGVSQGRFGIDYAMIFNPDLPLTHTFSFRYIP